MPGFIRKHSPGIYPGASLRKGSIAGQDRDPIYFSSSPILEATCISYLFLPPTPLSIRYFMCLVFICLIVVSHSKDGQIIFFLNLKAYFKCFLKVPFYNDIWCRAGMKLKSRDQKYGYLSKTGLARKTDIAKSSMNQCGKESPFPRAVEHLSFLI